MRLMSALVPALFAAVAAQAEPVIVDATEQTLPTPGEDIPVEEWTAMSAGRTLTYTINGLFFANEHYYPRSNRVTLQTSDGRCMQGTWAYEAPLYCFYWENETPACFRHTRSGTAIRVIETENGQDTPMTQEMTGVSDKPVTCGVPPTS